MKTTHPVLTLTMTAMDSIVKNRFIDANGTYPTYPSVKSAIGVSQDDAEPGDTVAVGTLGVFLVESGESIGAGSPVASNTSGQAVMLGSNYNQGTSLDSCTGAGHLIRIVRGI